MAGGMGLTGAAIARKAEELLLWDIPYKPGGESPDGMDCQGLVEYVLRALGMHVSWKGSNAMWRACTVRESPEQFRKTYGKVPPGALVFIWQDDGGERERGYLDGLGNAVHVGIYTGNRCVHASSSRGRAAASAFRGKTVPGGWNRIGLLPGIDYFGKGKVKMAQVYAENGLPVRLRKKPSQTADVIVKIPSGTDAEVLEDLGVWLRVCVKGQEGFMMAEFVRDEGAEGAEKTEKREKTLEERVLELERFRVRAERWMQS